jgi:hypothetical protein
MAQLFPIQPVNNVEHQESNIPVILYREQRLVYCLLVQIQQT